MAKKPDANPLERHIEKVVLGVCAVVTILILAGWVASSRRTVEVPDLRGFGTTPVPAAEADDRLLQAVRQIDKMNQDAQPDPLPRLGWVAQFKVAAWRPFPAIIVALDKGTAYPPILRETPPDPNALPSLAALAVVPPPDKPNVRCGPEVREPAAGLPPSDDDVVLHGEAVYPWADLEAQWKPRIGRLPIAYPVVLRVEVQIRSRPQDGPYDRGEGAPAGLIALPPADSQRIPLQMPVIPDYDGNNAVAVHAAIEQLRAPNWQKYILTPPYPNVLLANFGWVTWRIHLPDNDVSRRAEAAPAPAPAPLPPDMPPDMPPEERRPRLDIGRPTAPPPEGGGPGFAPPGGRPSAPPPEGAGPGFAAPGGRPWAPPPEGGGPGFAAPGGVPAPLDGVGPVWSEGVEPLNVKVNRIPELARQQEDGWRLLTWHVGGLKIGRAYQVRVRVVFLNPLLAQDSVQDRARDSFPKEIVGPWSEWSEECVVENPTRFFLTNPSQQGRLGVIVFTRKMGRIVKHAFDAEPGMAIGGTVRMGLANPLGGPMVADVDFSTGCTAVEGDLKRQVLRGGITGSRAAVDTAALLYLDEKGRLRLRLQVDDERSPEYEKLNREAVP